MHSQEHDADTHEEKKVNRTESSWMEEILSNIIHKTQKFIAVKNWKIFINVFSKSKALCYINP